MYNFENLTKPFPVNEIKWRVLRTFKTANGSYGGFVSPYINNRTIQERLDTVVGPTNWKNHYEYLSDKNILCCISIYDQEKQLWIEKWDGADFDEKADISNSTFKSTLSSSMKRAASQWGVGRYIYDVPNQYITIYTNETKAAGEIPFMGKIDGQKVKGFFIAPDINKVRHETNNNNNVSMESDNISKSNNFNSNGSQNKPYILENLVYLGTIQKGKCTVYQFNCNQKVIDAFCKDRKIDTLAPNTNIANMKIFKNTKGFPLVTEINLQ